MDTRQTVKRVLDENSIFPYLADEEITAGRDILCKICERILSSSFGVIELTERNPNVMFEFGFILASQKPVFVLYNKALAEKIKSRPPTDISALERIEYYNQSELYESFSKGLRKYIEEQYPNLRREEEIENVLVEVDSEELDLILDALKSSNDNKRLEAIKDLLLLSYRKRIVHDRRILNVIQKSLNNTNFKIRDGFLGILKIILRVEDDSHRESLIKNTLEQIIQISLQDEEINIRRKAFDVLEETNSPKIINPSFKAIQKFSQQEWEIVRHNVIDCLRTLYWNGHRRAITEKLYTLIDDPNLQERVSEILEKLRAS